MNNTILIADDEVNITILLKDFLEAEGYSVITAYNGKEAFDLYEENKDIITLIILDVMMPELDGWTVCREIRKESKIPIMMLTARSEDFDEIHGFEIGADDYVTKPVRPTALIARIHALFRRLDKGEKSNVIKVGTVEINKDSHIVIVDNEEVNLSPKEYALLITLIDNCGKVISREQLLNQVWGYDYFGALRTVDTHVNRLRIKLGDNDDLIATVRGFGYRFEGLL